MVEMGRGRSRPRWWLWLLAILALLAGAYFLLQPRVVEVAPQDGSSSISASSSIEIQFNRPMNRASVERHFQISPEVPGTFDWQQNRLRFQADSPLPEGEIVQVRLRPGATSALSLPLITGRSWQFQVSQPRVMYLSDRDGISQLEVRVLTEPGAERLVEASYGISDFDVSNELGLLLTLERQQDASTLFVQRDLNGQELAEIHRCTPSERCLQPTISLDGRWLAWQQQSVERAGTGITEAGAWQVMMSQVAGNEPPISLPEAGEVHSPHWLSSNRIAAYSESLSALVLYELVETSDQWSKVAQIDNQLGEQWTWSPEGRFVVFPEIILLESGSAGVDFFSHLFRAEVDGASITDLTGSDQRMVEDASPTYSPDGLQIAFARKSLDPAEWTLGRQLWVMSADGTQARPLTNEANFNHARIRWHPEGGRLVYVRFNQADLDAPTQIWWYDFESDQHQMVVEGGFSPRWMP